jgi:hypothetical protein
MAFVNARMKKKKQDAEDNEAEIIARDYLDSLADRILRVRLIIVNISIDCTSINKD